MSFKEPLLKDYFVPKDEDNSQRALQYRLDVHLKIFHLVIAILTYTPMSETDLDASSNALEELTSVATSS